VSETRQNPQHGTKHRWHHGISRTGWKPVRDSPHIPTDTCVCVEPSRASEASTAWMVGMGRRPRPAGKLAGSWPEAGSIGKQAGPELQLRKRARRCCQDKEAPKKRPAPNSGNGYKWKRYSSGGAVAPIGQIQDKARAKYPNNNQSPPSFPSP